MNINEQSLPQGEKRKNQMMVFSSLFQHSFVSLMTKGDTDKEGTIYKETFYQLDSISYAFAQQFGIDFFTQY